MTRTSRTLTVAASALTAVALLANPAAAAAGAPADVDFYAMPTGYSLFAQCSLVAGYSTDPRYITWVVEAQATATGPSVPIATSVQCTVYDSLDRSDTYGGASRAFPGPHVIAVGQATVPVGRVPAVCVTAGATYFDGTTISSPKSCP